MTPQQNTAAHGAGVFSFITDPPALREARLNAASARLAWENARGSKRASEALHRRYVLAKIKLMSVEGV